MEPVGNTSRLGAGERRDSWCTMLILAVALASLGGPGVVRSRVAAQAPQAEAVLEGTLEVQYEDFDGGSRLNHFLHTNDGRQFRLQFLSDAPGLLTGTRVRARGQLSNNTLALSSGSSVTTVSLASPYTFGPQSTIVILVNFQDNPVQPYTTGAAGGVTFGQTSNFYAENSYQQTSIVGDVFGWFTIAASASSCDVNTIASLAEQAATAAGANLGNYGRRIYGFPQTSACSWWGLSTVGGGTPSNPSRSWINGTYSARVVTHEYGHAYGDYHSHSNACSTSGCTTSEYGDDHDTMGSVIGHLNAYQKERFGWLNYGSSPVIQTLTANAQPWLGPYETAGGGFPKALKILYSSTSSGNTYLYVEARTQTGWDGTLKTGVLVHMGTDTNGNSSVEQDLDPVTTTTDLMLNPGQSVTYAGAVQPVTITTLSSDNTGALIDVNFGPVSAPGTPTAPNPAAGATGVSTTPTLTWSATGATSYDVSVGTTTPPPQVTAGQSVASYTPPTALAYSTTYFWQIVAHNSGGTTTGPVWSFTTAAAPAPPPCTSQIPTVSVSPSGPTWSVSGSTVNYTVTVTDTDSSSCSTSTFTLSSSSLMPLGWSALFDNSTMNLSPGASASTALHVTSASGTPGGLYSVTFSAVESNSGLGGTASVSEWVAPNLGVSASVSGSLNRTSPMNAMTTVTIGGTAVPGASVTVTVKGLMAGGNTYVVSGTTDSNGTATVQFKLNKAKDPAGTYQITVSATKSGILGTSTTSVNVQ